MKTAFALSAFFALITSPAFAMVAPYWDTVNQFEAVLKHDLSRHLGGRVASVKDLGGLQFELSSASCKVRVSLEAHAPNMPGVTSYTVKSVDAVRCK